VSTRVLGIDPSLTATGAVLLVDGQLGAHRLVSPPRELRGVGRLEWFYRQAWNLAADFGPIDHVAIEGYSYGSPNGMAALGELGGVLRLAFHVYGRPAVEIPPGTWRKQLFGRGNLPKDQVRVEAFKRHGVEFDSLDVLEAWAVAMALHRQLAGLDKPEPKRRRSA
jgi:Holliday junction resolvasome RuvABC endonuclease subunit